MRVARGEMRAKAPRLSSFHSAGARSLCPRTTGAWPWMRSRRKKISGAAPRPATCSIDAADPSAPVTYFVRRAAPCGWLVLRWRPLRRPATRDDGLGRARNGDANVVEKGTGHALAETHHLDLHRDDR